MSLHLTLLLVYSCTIVGVGIWTARLVRGSSEFFVAGRSLGPGLILASMLAANIGAGSTVGAAGLAYRDGLSASAYAGFGPSAIHAAQSAPAEQAAIVPKPDSAPATNAPSVRVGPISGQFSAVIV